jgi:splicing factor 3B subunit 2
MHWSAKRRYLATKRTTGKVQYDLPQYLKDTGIQEMRESLREKEQQMNLRAKMRAKVRPKLGKAQVDYQKLHDAFFRFQTKPHMSRHGELYYEGKEFEAKMRSKRAGVVSAELRLALGMGDDPLVPPPWLINMQRHGPPPSYPSLRIAGLNAPIPDG